MTKCGEEGALRAYLDGELPGEEMQAVAAHLGECAACFARSAELSERARRVSAMLEFLPECGDVVASAAAGAPPRPHGLSAVPRRARWVAAAVAIAAGLAVAAYLPSLRHPPVVALQVAPTAKPPAPAPVTAGVTAGVTSATVAPAVAARRLTATPRRPRAPRPPVRRAAPEPTIFMALDDEPLDTGVVMRVSVDPGNAQADIVFGPDGRARAFRVVPASQRNY